VQYFYKIVDTLVKLNYTRNKDIKGAPYDFRRAPSTSSIPSSKFKVHITVLPG
jgi:hypothetical protein